jgi:hypothetical protein
MRIRAVDIGTGTQDILLWDTEGQVENSPKMVVPSPTAIAARRIRTAIECPRLEQGGFVGSLNPWRAAKPLPKCRSALRRRLPAVIEKLMLAGREFRVILCPVSF